MGQQCAPLSSTIPKNALRRRHPRRALLVGGGALAVEATRLGAGLLLSACGDPSTGGERVVIASRAKSDLAENPVVDNGLGWTIEVTRAELALDHLYYVSGPPAGLAWRPVDLLAIPSAHAHPGHYDSGDVLGELEEAVSIDLLGPEVLLGEGPGVTGQARSAIVALGHLGGEDAALAVVLEGVASQGDVEIPFRAEVAQNSIDHPTSHLPEIDGCPLDDGKIESNGTVLLEVSVAVWLDRIDFAEVSVPGSGMAVLEPGTPPHNAFQRGLVKALGYHFTYSPG